MTTDVDVDSIELPDNHLDWLTLGYAKSAERDIAGACECFKKALECKPDYVEAQRALDIWQKSMTTLLSIPSSAQEVTGLQDALAKVWLQIVKNFYLLVRDAIPPVRIILTGSIVFFFYLIIGNSLFLVFDWLATDIKTRVRVVGWMLDIFQIILIFSVGCYFLINTFNTLRHQLQFEKQVERESSHDGQEE
jgi:tetratricopeptide (TPR) repeat protein